MLSGSMAPMEEIREIQEGMARIRHDLHGDVQGVVEEARAWTDWARFVRQRPLLVLGSVAALGYLIVPRRSRGPPPAAPAAPPAPRAATPVNVDAAHAPSSRASRGRSSSMLGMAFGLVSPIVVRAAQNYAIQRINQWMAEWQEAADQSISRTPRDTERGPVARRPGASG